MNDVFRELIKYSNYIDPVLRDEVKNLKDEVQKNSKAAWFFKPDGVLPISFTVTLLAACLIDTQQDMQLWTKIAWIFVAFFVTSSALSSKFIETADKKYMFSFILNREIKNAEVIQNGESLVNENIRRLKLLDNKEHKEN